MNRSKLIKDRLFECIHNGEVDTCHLIEMWYDLGDVLGVEKPSVFAKNKGINRQSAYAHHKPVDYFIVKFVLNWK